MWSCKYCNSLNQNNDDFCVVCNKPRYGNIKTSFFKPLLMGVSIGVVVVLLVVWLVFTLRSGSKVPPDPSDPPVSSTPVPSTPTPIPTPKPLTASEYTGGRGSLRNLEVTRVESSSMLVHDIYGRFPPEAVLDGDLATSWQDGVSGYGAGESITLYFDGENQFSVLDIYPGLQQNDYTFEGNGRPKDLILSFSDGRSCRVTLADIMGCYSVALSETVTTSYVKIEIDDVYTEKTRCEDTAISEIILYS